MKRLLLSLFICIPVLLAGLLPAGARADSSAVTWHPHWTKCVLHYDGHGGFLHKECYHYPLLHETRQPIGHTWHEVERTPTLSVRITWPIFQPPAIDMSAAARPCAWAWRGYIQAASQMFAVPTRAIAAVICVESSGQACPGDSADPYGSNGLMQLLPGTAAAVMGVSVGYAESMLCNPGWNILAGTKYLREQYDRFGQSWYAAAGAYNAGTWVNWNYVYAPNGFAHYYAG